MFSIVMNRLQERRVAGLEGEEVDAGFTLIELMVVLLILAILLAIAIPTFLGVTGSANDRAAQSNINTSITAGKSIYENSQQVYSTTGSQFYNALASNEPSLPLTTSATVGQGLIGVTVSTDGNAVIYMSQAKKTNNCWFLADNTAAVTTTSNLPWVLATTVGSGKGIPPTSGEVYGVYTLVNGSSFRTCDVTTLGGLTQAAGTLTESATAFPSGP